MHNDILSIMSSMSKVKLDKYKIIYDTLLQQEFYNEEGQVQPAYEMLNQLEALGHCEVDYSQREVYVCPPSFILLPHPGLPKAVYVGGRDETIIQMLEKRVMNRPDLFQYSANPQRGNEFSFFPSSYFITSTSKNYLKQLAEKIEVECNIESPPSWKLLSITPNLKKIKDSLNYVQTKEPNWKQSFFNHELLRFVSGSRNFDIKLVAYTNPITQQQKNWLWNGETAAEVDKNWGRYIVLNRYKLQVLLYDERKQKLGVPITLPFPKYLSRVATLCSGFIPIKKELFQEVGILKKGTLMLFYEQVPPTIANQLAIKLGQSLIESNL